MSKQITANQYNTREKNAKKIFQGRYTPQPDPQPSTPRTPTGRLQPVQAHPAKGCGHQTTKTPLQPLIYKV